MIRGGATRLAACLMLASLAPFGGCSFVFVRRAKEEVPGRYEPAGCTTSKVAPSVDLILTGAQAGSVLYLLTQPDTTNQGTTGGTRVSDTAIAVSVGALLVFAASAMYGFATVSTCREVTEHTFPYQLAPAKQTRDERLSDEAAEEAAVQARLRQRQAAEAAAAKAAGEAAERTSADPKPAKPAH